MLRILKLNVRNQIVFQILSKKKNFFSEFSKNYTTKNDASSKDTFAAQYCANSVKQYDHENYLCTLLLPGEKRRYAFTIRALNVEIAKIGDSVTEEIIGKMKLQFWRDSIDKCFDTKKSSSYISDHPVLRELKHTIDNNKLNKIYLKRLINARDRSTKRPFSTVKEVEDYAEQSVSSLYYCLLEIWNTKDMNVDHVASHLGKSQGIVNLLRSIPYQGRSSAVTIPQEILIKHGVNDERIIRDQLNDKGVEECVFEIATLAHQHLEKARSLSKHVPKTVKTLFLPGVAVQRYLDRLRKYNFRLSSQELLKRDQLLPLAYYWHKIRSKY